MTEACRPRLFLLDIDYKMFALYTEGPGELGLRAGDVVTGVEQVDGQWYRGTCRGSTGFFPISFVKVLVSFIDPLIILVKSHVVVCLWRCVD